MEQRLYRARKSRAYNYIVRYASNVTNGKPPMADYGRSQRPLPSEFRSHGEQSPSHGGSYAALKANANSRWSIWINRRESVDFLRRNRVTEELTRSFVPGE